MTTAPSPSGAGPLHTTTHGDAATLASNSFSTPSIAACNSSSDRSPHAAYPAVASIDDELSWISLAIHARHSGETPVDADGVGIADFIPSSNALPRSFDAWSLSRYSLIT